MIRKEGITVTVSDYFVGPLNRIFQCLLSEGSGEAGTVLRHVENKIRRDKISRGLWALIRHLIYVCM